MKHKIWSYFVKRFFDNKLAWHWWGSYHHWDPWCKAKIATGTTGSMSRRESERSVHWISQAQKNACKSELSYGCWFKMELSRIVSIGVDFKRNVSGSRDSIWKRKHISVSKYQGLHLETETRFRFQIPHVGNENTCPFPKNENRTVSKWKQKDVSNSSKHVMEEEWSGAGRGEGGHR